MRSAPARPYSLMISLTDLTSGARRTKTDASCPSRRPPTAQSHPPATWFFLTKVRARACVFHWKRGAGRVRPPATATAEQRRSSTEQHRAAAAEKVKKKGRFACPSGQLFWFPSDRAPQRSVVPESCLLAGQRWTGQGNSLMAANANSLNRPPALPCIGPGTLPQIAAADGRTGGRVWARIASPIVAARE